MKNVFIAAALAFAHVAAIAQAPAKPLGHYVKPHVQPIAIFHLPGEFDPAPRFLIAPVALAAAAAPAPKPVKPVILPVHIAK